MDYVYGFIAVAVIFLVVLVLLDYWYDALTQTSDHDRMIEQERCGHD